ncbi:MAG: transglycosylase domain-containing protein [Solirubrobacterales bacterium]
MPESKDTSDTDALDGSASSVAGNGASADGEPADGEVTSPAGSPEDGSPEPQPGAEPGAGDGELTPREQAKEHARQRAGERKRKREERRAEKQAEGRGLRQRLARIRDGEGWRRPPADGRSRPRIKKLRALLVVIGLGLLAIVSWVFGVMMAVAQDLPDLEARAQYDAAQNSVVLASDGTPLATLTGNEKRILVESDEISPSVKQAVVAIEDERFYEHRGIDYLGIARALQQDILSGGAVQGGSTITQQFVKNALEAQGSRTVLQKLREAALAYQIERQWSKDKILTNYLNNIYFGNGAYGIEAAARTYFGDAHPGCGDPDRRCAAVLTPVESAMLAALISSPTAYDPVNNPMDAQSQRNVVLQKMRDQGVLEVSDDDFQAMLDTPVPTKKDIQPPTVDSKAPYFTDWLRQQIVDKYGAGQAFGGGLVVKSTLDYGLQQAAEQAVADNVGGLGPTSAVVAIDNGSGEVLAMVGGQDFNESPFNLATNGQRQPGSSFKPFTLVTALKEGHSPDQTFESAPQALPFKATVKTKNGKRKEVTDLFRVNNYDDNYLGSASIATATTYSDNSVYAQLGLEVGINDIVKTAHDLGISSKLDDNPALILGGLKRGVTPLEMAYAYNTLANGGVRISGTEASRGNGKGPVAIDKVVNQDDKPVPDNLGGSGENEKVTDQVIDPSVAQTATDILRTVVTSGTGERAQVGDDYIWGKTGTTDNNADAWFVGANEDITVAVWVGYPDGATPMETEFGGLPVDGGTIPTLIFNDVVTAWDGLQASRDAEDGETSTDTTTTTETYVPPATTVAPATTAPAPTTPAPAEPAPATPGPDPATPATPDTGAGGTSAGGTVP